MDKELGAGRGERNMRENGLRCEGKDAGDLRETTDGIRDQEMQVRFRRGKVRGN